MSVISEERWKELVRLVRDLAGPDHADDAQSLLEEYSESFAEPDEVTCEALASTARNGTIEALNWSSE